MVIRRRQFLTGAAAAAATMATLSCSEKGKPAGAAQAPALSASKTLSDRPNILLLCIDDLNDWVGYLGSHPGVRTPNIDRLRAKSFSYNEAYCSVPVCIGSRASVLWGLTPDATGVREHEDNAAYWQLAMSPDLKPLPLWFSDAGYETISTGKVFHYQKGTPRFWDVFKPYKDSPVTVGDHGTFFDYGLMPPGEIHQDQKAADFAIAELQKEHDRPWFMAIGLFQPHVPWRLPRWAFDMHPLEEVVLPEVRLDDLDDIPPMGVTLAKSPMLVTPEAEVSQYDLVIDAGLWPQHVQAYLAACSHTDRMIGQILDALESSPYADNTAVVLWSDNGYHLGEKLHWRKMALWEHATRVPLLISAPGRLDAGGSFDAPVSLLDLAPTLTDLAGIATPEQFQGKSLIGITTEQANARPANMRWGDAISTRVGNWRWTRYPDGGQELYNHADDPREFNNLLGLNDSHEGGIATLLQRADPVP